MEERKDRGSRARKGPERALDHLDEIGKMPPQAVELEEAVLGAIILEKDALSHVIDLLHPGSFYREAHGRIFAAIQNLFQRADPVDILTVTQELRSTGELEQVGGAYYISQLTNRIASSANVEYHARIIAQKDIQRSLIRISSDTIREAYEETADVFDLMDSAERALFSVVEVHIRKNYSKMVQLLSQALEQIESAKQNKNSVNGVPSGFSDLDRITSGWQKTDLIIIAARPAMGKTSFLMSVARNAGVEFKRPVAIFSLEMASTQLVQRLLSSETEISISKIRKGNLDDNEMMVIHSKIGRLSEAPIFIDDTPSLSIFEFRAKCRRLKAQYDVEMVVVDYLQLMTTGKENNGFRGNREQEISTISRSLKSIAKELNIPIIALSQLSRAVETRGGDKKPQLSDLRESGAIEQDSDMVLFLHRPEYYGLTQDAEGNSTAGMAEIIVAKHRNGSVGSVNLRFIDKLAKFMNLNDDVTESQSTQPSSGSTYNPQAGLTPNREFSAPNPNNPGSIISGEPESDDYPF